MEEKRITIVIPVYNESGAIGNLLDKLKDYNNTYDIIVVDDGSTDGTAEVVSQKGFKLLRHTHNKGYGAALKTGIRNAAGDYVLTLDADGQHSVNDIEKIVSAIKENNYDMVVGARTSDSHIPFLRKPGKRLLSLVANYLAERKIPDLNSGFRVFKKDLALKFMHILPNTFSFTTTLTLALIKEGYEVEYIPITASRRIGKSTVKPIKDGLNTLLLITRSIVLFDPLKVFIPVSLLITGIGVGLAAYYIITMLVISKASVLCTVVGIMIFFFGLLADQISALRRELK